MAPTSENSKNNIIHIPMNININVNQAFSEYILEKFKEHSQEIAQIDSQTGKSETFGELLKRSVSLAQALKLKGITTDDIVAICCRNNMDYIVVIVASIFIGSRFCTLESSPNQKANIIECLKLTTPKIIFCEYETEDFLESMLQEFGINCEIVTFDETDKFISMKDFIQKFKSNEEFKVDVTKKLLDTGFINFTSGTTGSAKGTELSYYGFYYRANVRKSITVHTERIMNFYHPYWLSNSTSCIQSITNGITRIILQQFDSLKFAKIVQDFKVNYTHAGTQELSDLIKNSQCCHYDTTSLKYMSFGGVRTSINIIKEIQKLFPYTKFVNTYGLTELSGRGCVSQQELTIDASENISIGTAFPGYYYKVVDVDTDEAVGPHHKGELRIKNVGAMNGYLHQPEATAAAFDEDGYLKTGDIAYYDDNHNFFVVDRLKDIFKYKFYHISPVDIEDALLLHPDVKDCAVIPVLNEHELERPVAVIQLTENSKATEQDFIQHIKERLPDSHQLRGGVKFVDSIPRTTSGKLRRQYLKKIILDQN